MRRGVKEALRDAGFTGSIGVAFVGADEMAMLNRKFTGRGGVTDVLSFPMNEGDFLGDVVVCPARAKEEACSRSCDPMDEILLYAVHGTLHLLGYDDDGSAADEMYAKEQSILKTFGVEVD